MKEPLCEDELLRVAAAAARAGAGVLRHHFRSGDLDVRRKGRNDFVTRADHESEAAVVAEVRRRYPHHHILAEESGHRQAGGESDYQWIIDPLDGTTNFLQGVPYFCISVACRRGSEMLAGAVLDPLGDQLWSARRGAGAWWNDRPMRCSEQPGLEGAFLATGYPFHAHEALDIYLAVFREVFLAARAIRRCGAAALDLAYTAAGVYDGFFEFRLSPWDIAAGVLLVEEAGGRVTDLDGGGAYLAGGNVVAGGRTVQRELLAAVGRHTREADLDRLTPAPQSAEPAVAASL